MNRAVLRALVGDEGGAKEVGTTLQLQTHPPAEIGDLLRQPDDPDGGAVRFPFVPVGGALEFRIRGSAENRSEPGEGRFSSSLNDRNRWIFFKKAKTSANGGRKMFLARI